MNKIYLSIIVSMFVFYNISFGQIGNIQTVAGGGVSTADGVPSTSAAISSSSGVAVDVAGNIYYGEVFGPPKVRKVDVATGIVTTIAGTGMGGSTGDSGPATSATLSAIRGLWVDALGNVFIASMTHDFIYNTADRIRKVDAVTGIITTVAGGGFSTADGGPATDAKLRPRCVYVDGAGYIYTGAKDSVRRVDPVTGTISTIAGGGTSVADGTPATAFSIPGVIRSITADNSGNLYMLSEGGKILKMNAATGLMYNIGGGVTSLADGVPATSAYLDEAISCAVDPAGNVYVADSGRRLMRKIDATTGLINTIVGTGAAGESPGGTLALSANTRPYVVCVDTIGGYLYWSNEGSLIRRASLTGGVSPGGGIASVEDSFRLYINKRCEGPEFTMRTASYHSGMSIITQYGDGLRDTAFVVPSAFTGGGYGLTNHRYLAPGVYTVKHVLYNGITPVDSIIHSYDYIFCFLSKVRFFVDDNVNCEKEVAETYVVNSVLTEVDSNGVVVDTIPSTSGFNYYSYGNIGDVYTFKILSTPSALYTSCPWSGILNDTLATGVTFGDTLWFGLSCISTTNFDLAATAYVPVTGPNDQWGHIYIRNDFCEPTDVTATLHFSPKYIYIGGASPTPASSTASSITWNISGLSYEDAYPFDIYYVVWHNPVTGFLVAGDTVNEYITVTPTSGDVYPENNIIIRTDTVRASSDPNAIEVQPTSCFDADTTFQFTVHFENTGNDTAINIYVMDTLSENLDVSSLKIITSSDPMFLTKYVVDGKTILKFDFPNINLPDSSHHGECDGMFIYTIKNRPDIAMGASIFSRVGIYFDYNDVVMTNTVQNIKGCPVVSVNNHNKNINSHVSIYPNPVSNILTIETEEKAFDFFTITNTVGQQIVQLPIADRKTTISVAALPSGIYYVVLTGGAGTISRKFVKW